MSQLKRNHRLREWRHDPLIWENHIENRVAQKVVIKQETDGTGAQDWALADIDRQHEGQGEEVRREPEDFQDVWVGQDREVPADGGQYQQGREKLWKILAKLV